MRPSRSQAVIGIAALALTIIAVRAALVVAYANSIPWWEEWDALIDSLARKFASGEMTLGDLFEPNNEHTIFFTRLTYLTSLALNHGQFDNLPVALFDSLLAAGVWCVPTWLFLRRAPAGTLCFSFLFAAIGTIPLGWVNALHGFQNQFYFMLLGVMSCLWFASDMGEFRPGRFAAFVLSAVAATISMGAGFLAPLTAAGIFFLRCRHEPARLRTYVSTAAVGILIAMVGAWLFVRAEGRMVLQAPDLDLHDTPFWLARVLSCAAWPYGTSAVVGFLVSLPFCIFALRTALRGSVEAVDWFVCGFGVWVVGQIGAMAIYRHISGDNLPNRYVDVLAFWPLMNLYALLRLVAHTSFARRLPAPWLTAAAGLAFVIAIAMQVPKSLDGLESRSGWLANGTQRVSGYVHGDKNAFEAPGFPPAPYWSIPRLESLLDDPIIRDVLPPQMRMPLPLQPDPAAASIGFVPGGVAPDVTATHSPSYGSYAEAGERTTGVFRSQPMRSAWPYLVFDVAGGLPAPGLSLSFGDKRISPTEESSRVWRQTMKRTPKADFRIEAQDASATDWFAFAAPREAGRLSALVIRFSGYSRAHVVGLAAWVATIVVLLLVAAFLYRVPSKH